MDLNIAGKDINDETIRVGDKVELLFPFTPCVCEVKRFERGIFPDSEFQTVYGSWLQHCKKIIS